MSALGSKSVLWLVCGLLPTCAQAFDVCGEVLYWNASEESSSLWASSLGFEGDVEVFEAYALPMDWNVGARVKGGYTSPCTCWNVQGSWTWFETRGHSRIEGGDELIATEFFGGFFNKDISVSAKINIDFSYQMFALQLGREICCGETVSLLPYFGVQGGWIDQSIASFWNNILPTTTAKEKLTNDFWGLGPLAGVRSNFSLGCSFSLFGRFEMALLWGHWSNRDDYRNSDGTRVLTITEDSELGSLTLLGGAGLQWETCFPWGDLTIRIGYEAQNWFNQFRIATFQQLRLHGDLNLQGAAFEVCVGF